MNAVELPRRYGGLLQQLAAQLLDSRKPRSDNEMLARALLAGFHDICMRTGLDRVIVALEATSPAHPISDAAALAEHPTLLPALVAQLATLELDDGSPRNAKLRALADRVVAALGLTLVDDDARTLTLDDTVRTATVAALASVIDVELAIPRIRDAIIDDARARCAHEHLGTFSKMAAQLDENGMRMIKQPKVPLHVAQIVQQTFTDARNAVLAAMAGAAIDRAKVVIARADADAAARLDQPVSHVLTPRAVAILRACDARVPKVAATMVLAVLDSLSDTARLAWRAPTQPVLTYAASKTFVVGDLIEHPKFGRGTVVGSKLQRIDVEFEDDTRTLIHTPAK